MKKYLLLATAFTALASCTSDEFVGESPVLTTQETPGAIYFESSTPRITRSDGATAAEELGYTFAVYATKTVGTSPATTTNVFAQNAYSTTTNTPYWVWYETSSENKTTSNTHNWEYVGAVGDKTIPSGTFNLDAEQTIKYWDYSASQYDFVAYTAKSGGTVSNVTTSGFSFSGTAAQFADLYVADKLTITEKAIPAAHGTADNKIGDGVKFTFRSGAAKVRLGIYETIPGYVVQNVNFRPNASEFTATTANATLSGSFNGTSSSASGTYNITYNATSGVAEFDNTGSASNYFDFGTFASATPTAIGTESTSPMWATGISDYQSVLPNTDNVGNMILYVDYDLYNSTTAETIHVTGAKAVVPSIYMTWNPNYAYTYLFKISDNTNGYTGTSSQPAGLYPITFDAVTISSTATEEGSITTVSTPSITTYQAGSVSSTGITYASANGPIYITVNTDGTLATLTNKVKLYSVAEGTTEADLMLASGYAKTEIASGESDVLSVLDAAETVNSVAFAANTTAKFTPQNVSGGLTYAFEYNDGTTNYYKIIKVEYVATP